MDGQNKVIDVTLYNENRTNIVKFTREPTDDVKLKLVVSEMKVKLHYMAIIIIVRYSIRRIIVWRRKSTLFLLILPVFYLL